MKQSNKNNKNEKKQETKKTSKKLSIIVPCYKVEKYLPRCLDTLVNQTLEDIEAICINDGSPDNCLKILKDYLWDTIVYIDIWDLSIDIGDDIVEGGTDGDEVGNLLAL